MTWAKLPDTFIDDPGLLRLPRGVRLLYVEGLVWSCKHLTDGVLEGHVLHRLTDQPDVTDGAKLLVDAGLWVETEDGWQVVDFLEDQPSRQKVEKRLHDAKRRKERSERHQARDHSMCTRSTFCPDGELEPDGTPVERGTRGGTRDGTRSVRSPAPSRSDPSRPVPEGQGKGTGKGGADARPPQGSAGVTRQGQDLRGFTVSGPPPVDQLCDRHARDKATCVYCRQEAAQ